jgi:hypothetical protein
MLVPWGYIIDLRKRLWVMLWRNVFSEYERDVHKRDILYWQPSHMESKTDEFFAELEVSEEKEKTPKSFALFEEYSHTEIAETIRLRKANYEKADEEAKMKMWNEVEVEVSSFGSWLERTKNLEPVMAYYCSLSLKSLLLGLPTGVQIACLFGIILDGKLGNTH